MRHKLCGMQFPNCMHQFKNKLHTAYPYSPTGAKISTGAGVRTGAGGGDLTGAGSGAGADDLAGAGAGV